MPLRIKNVLHIWGQKVFDALCTLGLRFGRLLSKHNSHAALGISTHMFSNECFSCVSKKLPAHTHTHTHTHVSTRNRQCWPPTTITELGLRINDSKVKSLAHIHTTQQQWQRKLSFPLFLFQIVASGNPKAWLHPISRHASSKSLKWSRFKGLGYSTHLIYRHNM